MLNLSDVAKLEKNKLTNDGAWLILLEVTLPLKDEDDHLAIRIVRNNEDILWNGYTWVGFPFDLDELTEDSHGELPQLTLKVSNVTRLVQRYVEQANGGVGAMVKFFAVHSKYLDRPADIEETFAIHAVKCDANWVYFTLSGDFPTMRRIPEYRYLKDCCPFVYGGVECGVAPEIKSVYKDCSKTLRDCVKRNNARRFGGEPAIPLGGTYVSNSIEPEETI